MTTIAFIDDEINILNSIKRLLRHQKWEVLTFTSPQVAILDLKSRQNVEIIVSDYRMPEMNGVEALAILKDACPNALRMILSGQADLNGVLLAVNQAEIYRFITKPWVDEDFIITLEKAFQYQHLMRENLRLSEMVRQQMGKINRQQNELKRLESESPGITKVDWSDDGSIDMSSEFDDDSEN